MITRNYADNEKCTAIIAAELIYRSEDTGKRYLQRLRKSRGYPKYAPVSVGEFKEFYRLK